MENNKLQLAIEQTDDILEEIAEAFYDIPFENSQFQTSRFVVSGQHTPARAYRALGLRMNSKLQAIKELKFGRKMQAIDIDEYLYQIKDDTSSSFDNRRAQVEIEKLEAHTGYTNKLLNDAIVELNFMYSEFKKYPKYTRAEFEAEETEHFEKRLTRQIETQGNGSVESLSFMQEFEHFNSLVDTRKEQLTLESK